MKLFESALIEKFAALLLLTASALLALQAAGAARMLFEPLPPAGNSISVEGTGKVTAIPDIAKITFSVSEEADTAKDAQNRASEKMNAALELLTGMAIDEKDIKTTSYAISPKYSYPRPCYSGYCPPDYEQTIIGYTVSQTVEVKVRDTAKAGDVLSALGEAGVSDLYGPSFTTDDPEALKAEARGKAIADARAKAGALAKDLGVQLVHVTGFFESTGGYPIYYGKAEALGIGGDTSGVVPSVPTGENEISVTVNVTYEVR